jgi:hypothetical protein
MLCACWTLLGSIGCTCRRLPSEAHCSMRTQVPGQPRQQHAVCMLDAAGLYRLYVPPTALRGTLLHAYAGSWATATTTCATWRSTSWRVWSPSTWRPCSATARPSWTASRTPTCPSGGAREAPLLRLFATFCAPFSHAALSCRRRRVHPPVGPPLPGVVKTTEAVRRRHSSWPESWESKWRSMFFTTVLCLPLTPDLCSRLECL